LCLIAPLVFPQVFAVLNTKESGIGIQSLLPGIIAGVCALLAAGLVAAMLLSGKQPAAVDTEGAVAPALPSRSRLNR
jgi:branched-subunit amino acid transport protein